MRKIMLAQMVAIVIMLLCSCGGAHSEATSLQEESGKNNIETETVNDDEYLTYTYEDTSIEELTKGLEENPLKGESWVGQYVKCTGYFSYPEPNDKSVFIKGTISSDREMYCELNEPLPNSDEIQEKITVWGEITKISTSSSEPDSTYYTMRVLHYEFDTPPAAEDIVYVEYTAAELIDYYFANHEAAENELYHSYVSITAPIDEIDTDWIKFKKSDKYGTSYGTLLAMSEIEFIFTSDEQKSIIAQKNLGDTVTIEGRITDMSEKSGEVFGMMCCSNDYEVEIYSIK